MDFDTYPYPNSGIAKTPPLQLAPLQEPVLSLDVYIDVESFSGADLFTILVDDAGSLNELWSKNEVQGNTNYEFMHLELSLKPYAGRIIRIVFSFDTVDAVGNTTEGVYVDDVKIMVECNEKPEGIYETFYDVTGLSSQNIYACGVNGTIYRFDGQAWHKEDTGSEQTLRGIHGIGIQNIIAVGSGAEIIQYNGASWNPMEIEPIIGADGNPTDITDTLYGVWGAEPDDVWAVGAAGTLLNYDGISWLTAGSALEQDLLDIYGLNDEEIYAVGINGAIQRYGMGVWQEMLSGVSQNLYSVWGSEQSGVYATGEWGTVLKYK